MALRHSISMGSLRVMAAVALVSLSVSCERKPASAPARAVRVSPSELFVGDLKRLEPHLGLTTGCVRLDSSGPALWLGMETELWRGGKRIKSLGASHRRWEGPGEASISLKEETGPSGKPKCRLVEASSGKSGGGSATQVFDMPEPGGGNRMSHVEKLRGPVELSEGKPVAVWAYLVHEGPEFRGGEGKSIEEEAKRAKWAIVWKLSWEEPKDR